MTNIHPQKQLVTLTQYLENSKDLLAIFGVFIAIVGLSSSLGLKLIAAFISFFAFTCSTLILIEFWRKKPEGELSLSVVFFRFSLSLLAFALFLYWFTIFDTIFPNFIFFVSAILVIEAFIIVINWTRKKSSSLENFLQKLKASLTLQIFYTTIILTFTVAISYLISSIVRDPLFRFTTWIVDVSHKLSGPIL